MRHADVPHQDASHGGIDVGLQRRSPLGQVLGVPELRRLSVDEQGGALPEGLLRSLGRLQGAPGRPAVLDRVYPCLDLVSRHPGRSPCAGERDRGEATQSHVPALAADHDPQDPAACAGVGNLQLKAGDVMLLECNNRS